MGPMEGTVPPAAKRFTGVMRITARIRNLFKFLMIDEPG